MKSDGLLRQIRKLTCTGAERILLEEVRRREIGPFGKNPGITGGRVGCAPDGVAGGVRPPLGQGLK